MNKKIAASIAFISLQALTACNGPRDKKVDTLPAAGSKLFVLGVTDTILSAHLQETRTINIYLPEGYDTSKQESYPVIYLPDGGAEEDFIHITGLVRYNTQPRINRFPKTIVVGIENTNRGRDFTFPVPNLDFLGRVGFEKSKFPAYGGSENYIAFLKNELQPFIEKKYRAGGPRTLIGESLGGLLATEILLRHPELFNTYIIVSPSLWWNNGSLLKEAPDRLKNMGNQPINVYVGACNKEEDLIMYADAVSLAETLKKNGGEKVKTVFDYLPDETHATLIHQAVYNAFKLFYPLKK